MVFDEDIQKWLLEEEAKEMGVEIRWPESQININPYDPKNQKADVFIDPEHDFALKLIRCSFPKGDKDLNWWIAVPVEWEEEIMRLGGWE